MGNLERVQRSQLEIRNSQDERQKVDGNRVQMKRSLWKYIPMISQNDDAMMLVITQQKIEGSCEVSSSLLHLLEVTSEELNNISFSNDTEVVCTVVVLCWLRKNLFHRQQEWQMLEAKAIGWLTSKSLDNPVDDLIKETASLLWPSLLVYHF